MGYFESLPAEKQRALLEDRRKGVHWDWWILLALSLFDLGAWAIFFDNPRSDFYTIWIPGAFMAIPCFCLVVRNVLGWFTASAPVPAWRFALGPRHHRSFGQLGSDLLNDAVPIVRPHLPKQSHRRVPQGTRTIEPVMPAPVSLDRKKGPHRPAESAGKMGNSCVNRDYKVKMR